jgi:hypothetical protein
MSKLVSGRVKKLPQSEITPDRYEFLGLEQAEPDLGDPVVGPSSVGANPYTGNISNAYVLISDDAGGGNRYWSQQPNLIAGGIVNPGSITVRDSGAIIGSVNQITDINFIGSGVTVLSPASWPGAGSSSVDIQISVFDIEVPSGQTGSVGYRDSGSFLQGASDFIFNPVNNNVGIGSIIPRVKLDVLGNARISGILTVGILSATSGVFTNSLKVGNFEISDDTTFVRVISGSVGIGTSVPIATLDVRGTANVSGAATIGSVNSPTGVFDNLSANRITAGFVTATNSFSGFLTATNINNTNFISTNVQVANATITNIVGTSATIAQNLSVDTNTLVVNSATRNVGFGTTNPLQKVQVGVSTNPVVITNSGRIGIGTTNPIYGLDARTNVGFSSFIFVGGTSGNANEVLVSGGSGLPFWGAPSNITVGAANSIAIASTQLNSIFYLTFTQQTIDNAQINVDVNGLSYNPSLNYFGIGTTSLNYNLTINGSVGINTNAFFISPANNRVGVGTTIPTSTLDVIGDVRSSTTVSVGTTILVGSIANISSGIITTTSTSQVALNSINTSLLRSARYNIQVTTIGQLVGSATSSSALSVGNLQSGTNYLSGFYPNVALVTASGSGSDARADIAISPQKNLIITSISNGLFNVNETSGVTVNTPISFNRAIPATSAQNSRVTSISVSGIGSGYTSIPTIQISTPTNNPTIPGVTGIGSTATAVVGSLIVTNVSITNPGIHSTIPTVSFKTPVGSGSSAAGFVGVGVSSIQINNSGSGYNPLPTVNITGDALQPATVAISTVFVTNAIVRNTGFGYTSGNFPILTISAPDVGINTATAVVNSLGISTHFNIVPGIGYTRPPILTVGSPNVGINTANVTATLGISTVTVTSPGLGYTSSSQIQVATNPPITGFAATVGMGITVTNATFSGGNGYTNPPTITVSAPDVGFNTAVINFTTFIPGGPLQGPLVVENPGSGYFGIPTVSITGGGGAGAAITIAQMVVTDVKINNTGFGATVVPSISIVSPDGTGASGVASMGIGAVNVVGFGSGYNNPPVISITSFGGIGTGASVTAGLGLTSSNITITNGGYGYSSIPLITVSSGSTVSIAASALAGVGLTEIAVTNPGIGYTNSVPAVTISLPSSLSVGSGASAGISSVIVSNIFITNPGAGYTATDLTSPPIATFNPPGTAATVGFGVSTIIITNLGIGYTSSVAAAVSFSAPNLSTGTTATASASLGFPGILPGPGVNTTGNTAIYYVASVSPTNIGISTGVGTGTLTVTDVGDDLFTTNTPIISIGGTITGVRIISPGSGYTSTSVLFASNFDGANVGTGFSFTVNRVVNNYQFSDVMILQSVGSASTSCDFLEYGTIANNEILGSFNADISGNNARLLFTPTYRNNVIKISSHSITN